VRETSTESGWVQCKDQRQECAVQAGQSVCHVSL
jgi:hypothetical protein